jgi:hypothetical protein
VAEMVDFRVTVLLPGATPEEFSPSFADAEPTTIDVSSTTSSWLSTLWVWALVAGVGLVVLVVLRRAFRHARH